jgi:hypothetical protein
MTDNTEQRLQELMEHERLLIKKMNLALRAGANPQVLAHFDYLLNECRFAQQELKVTKKTNDGDNFDDYLSIG